MQAARTKILQNALQHIPICGFTRETLEKTAIALDVSPLSTEVLFPRGPVELVEYVMNGANRSTIRALVEVRAYPKEEMDRDLSEVQERIQVPTYKILGSPREVVKFSLTHRLKFIVPFASHWSTAIRLTLAPSSLTKSISLTSVLIDDIVYYATKGLSTSHGLRWYARRALLAGVYAAAELHLIGDLTEDKDQTINFIHTQVDKFWF